MRMMRRIGELVGDVMKERNEYVSGRLTVMRRKHKRAKRRYFLLFFTTSVSLLVRLVVPPTGCSKMVAPLLSSSVVYHLRCFSRFRSTNCIALFHFTPFHFISFHSLQLHCSILMPDHFVILESSRLRQFWDLLLFSFAIWNAFAIAYRLFLVHRFTTDLLNDEPRFFLPFDYVTDVFFIVNIFLQMKVFALKEVNEQGKTMHIFDRDIMLIEYWNSGRMTRDIFTALPYDLLGFFVGGWNMLRIPKLLMAFRFPYYIVQLKTHAEKYHIFVSVDAILTMNISFVAATLTHWIACSWAMIYNDLDSKHRLISGYYWTLTTITSVGFGDIYPITSEGRWFAVSMMILGSCLTAGVIANITSMAHKVVISEDNAQHVMTCVEKYMVEKEVSE